jgi:DNA helicase-2/ATP-dependent DNA helicase PcrA
MKKLKTIYNNKKTIGDVTTGISAHKGEGRTPLDVQKFAAGLEENDTTRDQWLDFANVFEEYNKRLKKMGKIDFEDMLQKSLDILQSDENVRKEYREKWHYVLVDEYQDNNYLQTEITKEIAPEGKITVVGDINQCIYSFQGANFKNFEIFKNKYKDNYSEFPISQNYRSTQKIVNVAKKLIPNTNLSTKNEAGGDISVVSVETVETQGEFIIEKINEHINTKIDRLKPNHKISYRDFQVMGRINTYGSDLKVVERKLREECIPFVADNYGEMEPNLDVLNEIKIALTSFMNNEKLNDETKLDDLIKKLDSEIKNMEPEKRKYYRSLKNLAEDFVRNHEEDTIDGFTKYLRADSGINNFVVLKTVHKSKGTEKPIVFIAGVNQGLFPMTKPQNIYSIPNELRHYPHQNSGIGNLEEEKRIFFVALTRAKNLIYVTCAEKRRWNNKPTDTRVSDFLNKLDYDNPDNPDIDFEIEPENGSTY